MNKATKRFNKWEAPSEKALLFFVRLQPEDNLTMLRKKLGAQHTHVLNLTTYFVEKGFMVVIKEGRECRIKLTSKGIKVQKHCRAIRKLWR